MRIVPSVVQPLDWDLQESANAFQAALVVSRFSLQCTEEFRRVNNPQTVVGSGIRQLVCEASQRDFDFSGFEVSDEGKCSQPEMINGVALWRT